MKKILLLGMFLSLGLTAAFGQKSSVTVFGVPFGSNYEDFLSAFREKGFTGNMPTYEGHYDVEIYGIYGTYMTYECSIEMRATKLTHSVYSIKISFSLLNQYKDISGIEQCRTIISLLEGKYGKSTLIQKLHGKTVVEDLEESSAAIWQLPDSIDLELYYRGFDDCKITYGGKSALNGLYQKEAEQYDQQKALEIQEKLSNSDF